MRVLILSQHFWPETFRINEVAESLQAAGCQVSVLTGQPNYPDGEVFTGYRAAACGRDTHAGIPIYRVPLRPRKRGKARQLVANYVSFIASASLFGPWLLRGQRFDIIFVYGTSPILQAIPAIFLRRIKRAALVTWVQDLWPDSLEVTGFVRNPRLLAAVASVVRWIYRRCDLLLAQSPAFVPPVRAMAADTPVEYHPHPGELAFGRAVETAAPVPQLPPGFNVMFAGNLGTVQSLDAIVDAAALLQLHAPHVRFVIVGSGSRGEWLTEQVVQRGLDNVLLLGRFDSACMPALMRQASALLVSLVRSPIMSQTLPGKVQAYLAAGRPIIASLDGEGARVVTESGAGLCCPAEDAAALAEAVRELSQMSPEARAALGDNGRRYYRTHFEPETLARQLIGHFETAVALRHADGGQPASRSANNSSTP